MRAADMEAAGIGPGDVIPAGSWVVDPEDRSTFYGATDIARLLGVDRFGGPIDVFLEKREKITRPDSGPAKMGRLLEDAICNAYADATGYRLRRPPLRGIGVPGVPLCRIHPDRFVLRQRGVMDAKATERTAEYGEPGTDDVPARVRVQMVIYLGATRRDWADVMVLPGATRTPPIYRVEPKPDLYEAAIAAALEFHERHVLAGVAPDPDGSASWRSYADDRFAGDGEEMPPATPEQMVLIDELREAFLSASRAEVRLETARQRLIDLLGNRTAMPTPYGLITYRRESARANPWEVARTLAGSEEAYRAALAADKAEREGSRVFRHPFEKEAG